MKRLVVCSDIHGFYDELIDALKEVNFNPEADTLISCGDAVDRGPKPRQVIEFLNNLTNKILIRGNHEDLMEEAIERKYFATHDISNGTADTAYDFCTKENAGLMNHAQILGELRDDAEWNKYINSLVDYYETENYVFCHGYVPVTKIKKNYWRIAGTHAWGEARWYNGFNMVENGYVVDGKRVVVGHWHCSYANHVVNGTPEFGKGADFNPYFGEHIICIDACTAHTKKVNVIVIEDNSLEDV